MRGPADDSRPFALRAREGDAHVRRRVRRVADLLGIRWAERARVAVVPETVSVKIALARIRDVGTIVARIAERVVVEIELARIGDGQAVVAGVADGVEIDV